MKQAAPMPGDYGNTNYDYGQTGAPMPNYGNTGYDNSPPAYSSNSGAAYGSNTGPAYSSNGPAYNSNTGSNYSPNLGPVPAPAPVPLGIVAVNCKQCGTHFGMPEGAQSVSCPGCQAVHDPSGNIVINVTNNVHHHYGNQGGAVAVAAGSSENRNVPGFPTGPNNFNPAYPAPAVVVARGPLAGYAPDQEGGLGHCCDCGELKGEKCCANSFFFFTLCRQARTYSDGVCDSTVGHWCFYIWCYPFHVLCDILMFLLSPFIFLITFIWCAVTYLCCCCEHKGGPLSTACYVTSRSLTLSVFLMCFACCCNGC